MNELIVVKDFYKENYHPLEISTALEFNLSSKWLVNGRYSYNNTLFYTYQIASLGIKYLFLNEDSTR